MMKKLLMLAVAGLIGFTMSACGTISVVKPEPVPLSGPHLGKMALDHTAVSNTINVCGSEVTDFKTSLRNGFDYIAGKEIIVTSPEQATSTLRIDALDASCLDDKFVDGSIITIKFKYTWKFNDGSEFSQEATIPGGSQSSVEDALIDAVEGMYNFVFASYLNKLNLGASVQ